MSAPSAHITVDDAQWPARLSRSWTCAPKLLRTLTAHKILPMRWITCIFAHDRNILDYLALITFAIHRTSNKPESPVWSVDKELREKDACKHFNGEFTRIILTHITLLLVLAINMVMTSDKRNRFRDGVPSA